MSQQVCYLFCRPLSSLIFTHFQCQLFDAPIPLVVVLQGASNASHDGPAYLPFLLLGLGSITSLLTLAISVLLILCIFLNLVFIIRFLLFLLLFLLVFLILLFLLRSIFSRRSRYNRKLEPVRQRKQVRWRFDAQKGLQAVTWFAHRGRKRLHVDILHHVHNTSHLQGSDIGIRQMRRRERGRLPVHASLLCKQPLSCQQLSIISRGSPNGLCSIVDQNT
mmetsp:Transcript_52796/g.123485  ORF Transcript_52796/g.123485 Transcript_52796/m.123485 type:complete len:220 (+) Transcript_52796:720-1379(+)